ncbi:hypothetical protein EDC04DRAFT_2979372 [Pisolithus marmoratus]|nr:hypothetical protein EDC04DRAFT_2979372 [Pisolithus marmoratus]
MPPAHHVMCRGAVEQGNLSGLPVSSPVPNPADPAIKSSALKSSSGSISTTNMDMRKKVAFLSPPQTPSGLSMTQPLPDTNSSANTGSSQQSSADAASKSTTTSTPSPAAAAPPAVTTTSAAPSIKATSTHTAASPYPVSLRSQTLFSQMSMSSTRILVVSSWSEGAEEDLVSNLGPRELDETGGPLGDRCQYVGELQKMKETFIDPLLHPYASPPPTSPTPYDYDDYSIAPSRFEATQDSMDTLPPIAARFMSPTGFRNEGPSPQALDTKSLALTAPNIDGESVDTDDDDAKHVHWASGQPCQGRGETQSSPLTLSYRIGGRRCTRWFTPYNFCMLADPPRDQKEDNIKATSPLEEEEYQCVEVSI